MNLRNEVARQIVERFTETLKKYVRCHLKQRFRRFVGSSDVLQDGYKSFFEVFNKNQIDNEDEIRALLITIVSRKLCNVARRYSGTQARDIKKEQPALVIQSDGDEIEVWDLEAIKSGPSHEECIEAADMVDHLLSGLTSDEARIMKLRYDDQLTYREIAEQFSITPDAIRKRLDKIEGKMKSTM